LNNLTSTTTHRFGGRLRLCGHGYGCGGGGQSVRRRYDAQRLPDGGHGGRQHDGSGGGVHGVCVHRPMILQHVFQVANIIDHVMDHLQPGYPLVLGDQRHQVLELGQVLLDLFVFQVTTLTVHPAAGHCVSGRISVAVIAAAVVVVVAAHRYGFHDGCSVGLKRNETNSCRHAKKINIFHARR